MFLLKKKDKLYLKKMLDKDRDVEHQDKRKSSFVISSFLGPGNLCNGGAIDIGNPYKLSRSGIHSVQ
jgi:hypothetical protein